MGQKLKLLCGEVAKAALLCAVSYIVAKVGDKVIERIEARKSQQSPAEADTFRS